MSYEQYGASKYSKLDYLFNSLLFNSYLLLSFVVIIIQRTYQSRVIDPSWEESPGDWYICGHPPHERAVMRNIPCYDATMKQMMICEIRKTVPNSCFYFSLPVSINRIVCCEFRFQLLWCSTAFPSTMNRIIIMESEIRLGATPSSKPMLTYH